MISGDLWIRCPCSNCSQRREETDGPARERLPVGSVWGDEA